MDSIIPLADSQSMVSGVVEVRGACMDVKWRDIDRLCGLKIRVSSEPPLLNASIGSEALVWSLDHWRRLALAPSRCARRTRG